MSEPIEWPPDAQARHRMLREQTSAAREQSKKVAKQTTAAEREPAHDQQQVEDQPPLPAGQAGGGAEE